MEIEFQYLEERITLQAEPDSDVWRVLLSDGTEHRITAQRLPDDILQITEHAAQGPKGDGGARTFRVPFASTNRGIELSYEGQQYAFTAPTPARAEIDPQLRSGELIAPMAGLVVEIKATAGDRVAQYQPIATIESMKVYSTLDAPYIGTVAAVYVTQGQRVGQGDRIADIVPMDQNTEAAE